jgi:hypothetical protein
MNFKKLIAGDFLSKKLYKPMIAIAIINECLEIKQQILYKEYTTKYSHSEDNTKDSERIEKLETEIYTLMKASSIIVCEIENTMLPYKGVKIRPMTFLEKVLATLFYWR